MKIRSFGLGASALAIVLSLGAAPAFAEGAGLPVEIREDRRFICSHDRFRRWASGKSQLRMEFFYREMRRETGLLIQGDKPEGEATESAGAKEVRSLKLRMIEELSTLHKAAKREEGKNNLGKAESEAATFIASALKSLGVDLTLVK